MYYQQIRSATFLLEYAGKKFLMDPWFNEKGTMPPYPTHDPVKNAILNPTVDLPMPIEEIINGVDAVFISHYHDDHFNDLSAKVLRKDMPIFVRNLVELMVLIGFGFTNVTILSTEEPTKFGDILLTQVVGQHSDWADAHFRNGGSSGLIFERPNEKTFYYAADTIYYEGVEKAIQGKQPDYICLNCSDGQIIGMGRVIMNLEDVLKVLEAAPNATIIASHMDACNHLYLSREQLRHELTQRNLIDRVIILEDGEGMKLD